MAIAILAIGVGLALAPAIFLMFTRAPGGGRMIDGFAPFMTEAKVGAFQGYMAEMGDGHDEVVAHDLDAGAPQVAAFRRDWPGIDADMGEMLQTMDESLDNFRAVDALPPFALFPWFFVLPGVMAAGLAIWLWRRPRRGVWIATGVLGVGLIAAPAVFQMFTRAPLGGQMINDFKPLMTEDKVTRIQGYFLTLGAAEGELRTTVVAKTSTALPAIEQWSDDWPRISNEMAPMIGAMSDNVGNFQGVAALPPFPLFPWFFVIPGVMVIGLAAAGARRTQEGL